MPKTIISYHDSKFSSKFWKGLFEGMETKLNFSTTCHPQTNGKTERTNHILEDMLRICDMDKLTRRLSPLG